MTAAHKGRLEGIDQTEGANAQVVWPGSLDAVDSWVVLAVSPNRDATWDVLTFVGELERQAQRPGHVTCGLPVVEAGALVSPELQAKLPTSEADLEEAVASAIVVCCLVLGLPWTLIVASTSGWCRNAGLVAVLLPPWPSFPVRAAARSIGLRDNGLVSGLMGAVGLIDGPLPMIFNRVGAMVAMTRIPPPLTRPGVLPGVLLVRKVSIGCYIAPTLLGGSGIRTISGTIVV